MEVGGVTETVQVTGASPIVDTTSTTTGAVLDERDAQAHPGRPPCHRHALLAPGVSSSGSAGRANPSMSGGSRPRQPVRRRRRQHHQHRLRRGRLLLDHLRLARHRHAVRLRQGSPGQDRRLRGGVRPGDGRRRERRDQERHEPLRGSVFGYARPTGLEGEWKTVPVAERHDQHAVDRRSATSASRPAVRSSRTGCSSSARSTRRGRRGRSSRRAGLPAAQPSGEVDRKRRTTVVLGARRTWQLSNGAPHRRLVLRRPVEGRHWARSAPRRCSVTDTSSLQRARLRRPQPDGPLRRRAVARTCCSKRLLRAPATRSPRLPSVDAWRVTDTTVSPNVITGGIGFYERATTA